MPEAKRPPSAGADDYKKTFDTTDVDNACPMILDVSEPNALPDSCGERHDFFYDKAGQPKLEAGTSHVPSKANS